MGRPKDKDRTEAFLEVTSHLEENDDEQITVTNLVNRMEDNMAGSEHCAYSRPQMLQKLQEHFGERIIQTEIQCLVSAVPTMKYINLNEMLHTFP